MSNDVHIPAEWHPHRAMWVGFPSAADLWQHNLAPAQAEAAALVRALAEGGETVRLLAGPGQAAEAAHRLCGGAAEIIEHAFGDIWIRDTGPIFARRGNQPVALRFWFNGWGGKYILEGDETVPDTIASRADSGRGVPVITHPFVLEGGAIDLDGEGTVLTTRQCVLNANRNEGWNQARASVRLQEALGVEKVLWIDEGLAGDHTDGHVDNIARFVAPGRVVCQRASGADDPNARVLERIATELRLMTDARGRPLEVHTIASPGRVLDEDGNPVPASHMNFLIADRCVVVPVYEEAFAPDAISALEGLFPDRRIVALPARALLTGGGAFHCMTQQEPA
jgi:agmatine deiminase